MVSYQASRIVPIVIVGVIALIAVIALIPATRDFFFGGNAPTGAPIDSAEAALINTDADRAVRLVVRGSIVADEDFRSYHITISPSQRIFTLFKGYQRQTIRNISLSNNTPAYEQFVHALNREGLMAGTELTGAHNDTRGVCPTGRLYEFLTLKAGETEKRLWTTSCGDARGSLGRNRNIFVDLFIKQIPDSDTLADDVD